MGYYNYYCYYVLPLLLLVLLLSLVSLLLGICAILECEKWTNGAGCKNVAE